MQDTKRPDGTSSCCYVPKHPPGKEDWFIVNDEPVRIFSWGS